MEAPERQIAHDGFAVIGEVFQDTEVDQIQAELCQALTRPKAAVIHREGAVVGARNLFQVWPEMADVWRRQPLVALLTEVLGSQVGLVRALYFDKPPAQTWCLPWHKDLTIAVRDNHRPSSEFRNPTAKAGVPHVEAPRAPGIDADRAHSSRRDYGCKRSHESHSRPAPDRKGDEY